MEHHTNEDSPARNGNTPSNSNALVTLSASSAATPQNNTSNTSPLSLSPSRLHSSQSLPIVPSQYDHNHHPQWNSPMYHNQQEEPLDGLRVTTLVGLGGLIGWTAAAAYRWLNGGEFSMFPPPSPTTRMDMESSADRVPNMTNNNRGVPMPPLEQHQGQVPTPWNHHQNIINNNNSDAFDTDTVGRGKSSTEELSKQVKNLVDALQKQSTEYREITKRLTQQTDTRQTNESMQRLRAAEQQKMGSGQNHSIYSAATQVAMFCKLAEIQAELSSLRRDVQSLRERADKWDQRLSYTI